MNILLVCSISPPEACKLFNETPLPYGGWLVSALNNLSSRKDIKLSVAFPKKGVTNIKVLNGKTVSYYVFPQMGYKHTNNIYIEKIVDEVKPDIIHIFGTEFPYITDILNCVDINKVVVNLQGFMSLCAKHYFSSLPIKILFRYTVRDLIKRENIITKRKKISNIGTYEIQALKMIKNVIGRTTWDYAYAKLINNDINYFFCNEILREEFYKYEWNIEKCEKHSIFTSQGTDPLKGLHYLLEAMPMILNRFPDSKLYIGGYDITKSNQFLSRFKISSYSKYLKELINKNNLQNKIIFTGLLAEKNMCKQFLKCNVFVLPSTIENESNSLSEAKILGVPSVAAYVGGVTDRIDHGKDGFFYQHDAPYMLAHYVCKIFENDNLALELSKAAKKNAQKVNDVTTNINTLVEIYKRIHDNKI